MRSRFRIRASGFVAAFAVAATLNAQEPPTLEDVLQRMRAYLADYAHDLPAMIATEHYEQRDGSGLHHDQRQLISDYALIQIPGEPKWLGFREVLAVDGKPVNDSARRLADLFTNHSLTIVQQARRIAEESARFNIGPVVRTINDPAVVLELLDGRHSERIRFSKSGEATVGQTRAWIVKFRETAKPTVIQTRDRQDLPAAGRAWINPQSGQILRVEATVVSQQAVTCTVDVIFERDARLGFAVPVKMTERYANGYRVTVFWGDATYSNYRKFTVETKILP
jgi:hypothetical protein